MGSPFHHDALSLPRHYHCRDAWQWQWHCGSGRVVCGPDTLDRCRVAARISGTRGVPIGPAIFLRISVRLGRGSAAA
jgi:hypothetical protein